MSHDLVISRSLYKALDRDDAPCMMQFLPKASNNPRELLWHAIARNCVRVVVALLNAIEKTQNKVAYQLLEAGASIHLANMNGNTALHMTMYQNHE